ncbi:hypothetical protein HSBAA_31190 [Vreelandella sulfidaeris]|uniref:Coenzyme PQQ synthesis protein D n=1 Tax=Vreelandella sulfidaeris TaxID=115553 RepID=A0A455U990_9GAMM|nr:hypothetical protein HSBAA_31190 [Halomonas sulfidaeris]
MAARLAVPVGAHQDCFVLLYPEGMVKLNETAGAILNQIDGERSVSSIIKNLEALYPEAGALEGDVLEFLSEAQQNGWLTKEA